MSEAPALQRSLRSRRAAGRNPAMTTVRDVTPSQVERHLNSSSSLSPKQERHFLLVLSAIQFTHILDFMIMMPLGPQLIRVLQIDTHQFGLLLSSYTFTAAASGLL